MLVLPLVRLPVLLVAIVQNGLEADLVVHDELLELLRLEAAVLLVYKLPMELVMALFLDYVATIGLVAFAAEAQL